LPVTDRFFRPLHASVVVALGSRRVVHVVVTRHPTGGWVAQQLREVTPFDQRPRCLIRDNDGKYGSALPVAKWCRGVYGAYPTGQ
jgi:putative transposase